MNQTISTGCCPPFDPTPWDGQQVVWEGKLFVKDRVTSILHIPINFAKVLGRIMDKITREKANCPQSLMLSDENSLWGADLYVAVDKEIPGAEMKKITGTFMGKVFEGPYSNAGKWAKEAMSYYEAQGKKASKLYFWYTTCPKCAKVYGKNYVVLFGQI